MGPLRVLHFKGSQLSSAISQFLLLAFHLALNVAQAMPLAFQILWFPG